MLSTDKMQTLMSYVLLLGTLLSTGLVMIGGILYLRLHGHDYLQNEWLYANNTYVTVKQVWAFAFGGSPLGIIQLGLLLLVATQTLRMVLLCWFYTLARDYRFALMSLFILVMLIYSSFWRS